MLIWAGSRRQMQNYKWARHSVCVQCEFVTKSSKLNWKPIWPLTCVFFFFLIWRSPFRPAEWPLMQQKDSTCQLPGGSDRRSKRVLFFLPSRQRHPTGEFIRGWHHFSQYGVIERKYSAGALSLLLAFALCFLTSLVLTHRSLCAPFTQTANAS